VAGRGLAEHPARLRERLLWKRRRTRLIFGDDENWRGRFVAALTTQGDDLYPAGNSVMSSPSDLPESFRIAHGDFEKLQAGGRGHLDLRLQEHEGGVEEQDRPGHAERIGDRVADGGIVVAERRNRRLQRGVLVPEPANNPSACPSLRSIIFTKTRLTAPRPARRSAPCSSPEARRGWSADEELLSVLDAHAVEEEREPQRPDHR
jgi:hypothetical protein